MVESGTAGLLRLRIVLARKVLPSFRDEITDVNVFAVFVNVGVHD